MAFTKATEPRAVEDLSVKHSVTIEAQADEHGAESTSDIEKQPAGTLDGKNRQIILKRGDEWLVTWTKDEERRVVRKADFLFLPIFTVSVSNTR